jgi:hypothetical protein
VQCLWHKKIIFLFIVHVEDRAYHRTRQAQTRQTRPDAMVFNAVNPPKEPAEYNPRNKFEDPVTYLRHREAAVAEKFVDIAEAKVGRVWAWLQLLRACRAPGADPRRCDRLRCRR